MAIGTTTMNQTMWNTITTSLLPQWYNKDRARDVVSKGTPFLYFMLQNAQERQMARTVGIRLLDTRNTAEAYDYFQTVPTTPIAGARAGEVTVAMYSSPLAMSEQDELELGTDEVKITDRIKQLVVQTEMGYAYRLAIDLFAGSVSNSKRINGLEQILYPVKQNKATAGSAYSAETSLTYYSDSWRFRAATNTYAGITRVAFTDDEVAGTGWEGVAASYLNSTNNRIQYSSTAPYGPDIGLECLDGVFDACTYGGMAPDLIVSGRRPWHDYRKAAQAKSLIYKATEAFTGAELAFKGISYNGNLWIADEYCKSWNTMGDATAGRQTIYMLHAMSENATHRLVIDPRKNFDLTMSKSPVDSFSAVQFVQLRAQQINESPRNSGVIFDYPS